MNTAESLGGMSEVGAPEPVAPVAAAIPPYTPPPSYVNAPNLSPAPQPLSPADERTWAMLAHLSVLLNLVTGFLGVGVALLIYLLFKDRSRYVRYQAFQAFIFQLICFGGVGIMLGLMWAIVGVLSIIIIGILLIPFALIITVLLLALPLIAFVYGIIGAIQTSEGQDFRYWPVGTWALNLM